MDKLSAVFREVFDRPDLEIEGLTRSNFPEWDSLAHVKIIISFEEEFDLKLSVSQMNNIQSVEDLRRILRDQLGS